MAFPWRILLSPTLLACLKAAHINIYLPHNLLVIRILFACAQLVLFAFLGLIYQRISRNGNEKKFVKVKKVAMAVGIHVCMAYMPILFMEMVSELFTFYNQAYYLFALYILNSKDDKLKRPFPIDSLVAKSEAMKKELAAEQERQVKKNNDDVGEPMPAIEDSVNTTGSQLLSRAERRLRRVEIVDVNEE